MFKKIAPVIAATLLVASCAASPEELKETYLEKMQEYGIEKVEAVDMAKLLCEKALDGEKEAYYFMERIEYKGGGLAELVNVVIEYGIPAYCPKYVNVYNTGQSA